MDGIIVPGGFGDRGIEGMIQAAQYARENRVPYFGICLGMQIAVMEYARNVLGYADANSSEFTPESAAQPVIDLMPDQQGDLTTKGGTMRLGAYPCVHHAGHARCAECYGTTEIDERHRHRYEFNNEFRDRVRGEGPGHRRHQPRTAAWWRLWSCRAATSIVGVQFHPEFKSRPEPCAPACSRASSPPR